MIKRIDLHYFNAGLNIALADWRNVYLLDSPPKKLSPEVYRGKLVYRAKGSSLRITYAQIKRGLVRKMIEIKDEVPDWL